MGDDPRRRRVPAQPTVRFQRIEAHHLNEGHLRCAEQPSAKRHPSGARLNAKPLRNAVQTNGRFHRIEGRYRSAGLHRVRRLREEQMSSAASLYGLDGRSA